MSSSKPPRGLKLTPSVLKSKLLLPKFSMNSKLMKSMMPKVLVKLKPVCIGLKLETECARSFLSDCVLLAMLPSLKPFLMMGLGIPLTKELLTPLLGITLRFSLHNLSVESEAALVACTSAVPSKLSSEQKDELENVLTLENLASVLALMADEKASGIDGFPCEFYKACWSFIGLDLHHVYLEALRTGSLGDIINCGNVKLIPKEGDPKCITNWRPITLLNVSYKLIAKALALKLRPLLLLIFLTRTNIIH